MSTVIVNKVSAGFLCKVTKKQPSPNSGKIQMVMKLEIDLIITSNRTRILDLARKHGVRNVRVFGSFARGQAGKDSDIDFLVDLDPDRSLMDLGGLLMDLQTLLGRRVDVVTEKALHRYIRDQVIREAKPL